MGWTKRQYVAQAFVEIGLADYLFDITPEELQTALIQLDSMMTKWNGRGVRLGWPAPTGQVDSDLDQETVINDAANEAIYCGLAVRIAPSYGKDIKQTTAFLAKEGYDLLLSLAARPMEKQLPTTMPAGAGNKPWRMNDNPFIRPACDPLLTGGDGTLEFD